MEFSLVGAATPTNWTLEQERKEKKAGVKNEEKIGGQKGPQTSTNQLSKTPVKKKKGRSMLTTTKSRTAATVKASTSGHPAL
jgi:hypothetical protein